MYLSLYIILVLSPFLSMTCGFYIFANVLYDEQDFQIDFAGQRDTSFAFSASLSPNMIPKSEL